MPGVQVRVVGEGDGDADGRVGGALGEFLEVGEGLAQGDVFDGGRSSEGIVPL